jgi:hypothetical protein
MAKKKHDRKAEKARARDRVSVDANATEAAPASETPMASEAPEVFDAPEAPPAPGRMKTKAYEREMKRLHG